MDSKMERYMGRLVEGERKIDRKIDS